MTHHLNPVNKLFQLTKGKKACYSAFFFLAILSVLFTAHGVAIGSTLSQDFESGLGTWTANGLWHLQSNSTCIASPYHSATTSAAYNQEAIRADSLACTYNTGATNSGNLVSPAMNLSGANAPYLTFWSYEQTEADGNWDKRYVDISTDGGTTWTNLWTSTTGGTVNWYQRTIDLSAYKVANVKIRFRFNTLDSNFNDYDGWYVDDVLVHEAPVQAVNTGMTVNEDSTGNIITTAMLQYTDAEDGAGAITYTITTAPTQGTLKKSGAALVVGGTFTQANINASNITYDRTLDSVMNDSFQFKVKDSGAAETAQATFNITVTPLNDAPVLDNSGTMTLSAIEEDNMNSNGNAVWEIIASAGGNRITDVDAGDGEGIAITGLADTNGVWQYKVGAGAWTPISGTTPVADNSALLLADTDRVRFVPNQNYVGSSTGGITFRAWDRTSGLVAGDANADTTTNGGTSAFSTNTETAAITVTGVNDDLTIQSAGNGSVTASSGNPSTYAGGTASPGPLTISYVLNDTVTLTATPQPGYEFVNWTGSVSGTTYPLTVTMDGNKSITANFALNEECIRKNQKINGGQWNLLGTFSFAALQQAKVKLTRENDATSTCADAIRFQKVGGGADIIVDNKPGIRVNGIPGTLGVDGNYAMTGSWSVSSGDNGYDPTIPGFDPITSQKESVASTTLGSTATWTANIPVGQGGTYNVYASWTVSGTRAGQAPYCVSGASGHTLTAIVGANGKMNHNAESYVTGFTTFNVAATSNTDHTFQIEAIDGYVISDVFVDGVSVGDPGTYTFTSVASDHTIESVFDFAEPTQTCVRVNQRQNGGKWNLLGTFKFASGTGGYVTVTREANDGTSTCADAVRFKQVISGSQDIIIDNGGSGYTESGDWSNSSASNYYGTQSRYSADDATPGVATWRPTLAGGTYEVYAWWTVGGTRAAQAPYCVHNHLGKGITATAGTHGALFSPTTGVTVEAGTTELMIVDSGSSVDFYIIPELNYVIKQVTVDGGVSQAPTGGYASGVSILYTFTNVLTEHTINASFEDHGEACDSTATTVTCHSGTSGFISPAGDNDYFKIDLTGSARLSVYTEGSTDTYGRLLNSGCTDVATDDNSGPGNNFLIEEDVEAGTYYIVVRHANQATGTGAYTLRVECQHIIRAIAQSGGTIYPQGDVVVNHGSGVTFSVSAAAGNAIDEVLVDGVSVGALSSYVFTNVTANHTITASFALPPGECNDISDVPLDALTRGTPPNIMFVLDDSGSMDWEFITEEFDGLFESANYVFDNPGDNVYTSGSNAVILTGSQRGRWKSQASYYNKIYYNPRFTYEPWPTLSNAHLNTPRSHPTHATPTFNMDGTYYTVGPAYIVDNSGTFLQVDGTTFSPLTGATTFTVSSTTTYPTRTWKRSTASNWYGSDPPRSIYADVSDTTAAWRPTLPAAGTYEVYAWWTVSGTRYTNVPYTINHTGGTVTVNKNQQLNGGKWNLLGTWNFNAGSGASVVVRHNTTTAGISTSADAIAFVPTGSVITVRNSHYYTWDDTNGNGTFDSGEAVYLVNLNGTTSAMEYYLVNTADETVEMGDLTSVPESSVPATVRPMNADGSFRTYTQERQNFTNWYSYFRRRELTATSAISKVITEIVNAKVGIRSINAGIVQPVLPVNVGVQDETQTLLNALYALVIGQNSTPLRHGLQTVGQYFHQDDGINPSGLGTSPYLAEGAGGNCQQSFAIMMTDGYYNDTAPSIGNADGDQGAPYADTYSNTLADVAMYYYKTDLASSLSNNLAQNPLDSATHQHMVTYGVSFGVTGTLDPDAYDLTVSGVTVPWPNPTAGEREKIDDLWHASLNGHGLFLSASNPRDLIDSLIAITRNIAARTGSASSVSVNGDELFDSVGTDVRMFQASYSSGTNTGDVNSFRVDEVTGSVIQTPLWSAADKLDNLIDVNDHTSRKIATFGYLTNSGIPFRYTNISASGTTQQLNMLDPDYGDPSVANAENLVNYVRGDDTYEQKNGGPFRTRTKKLGDIVHSSPLFVNGTLYVGANDGMLHAFDATSGDEIFAYVPGLVYENLKELGDPEYIHKFYVDLTPYAESGVTISGTGKTLLVGGLGKGGRGYYALDISGISGLTSFQTQTETNLAGRVLWEYPRSGVTDSEIDDMGFSYSRAFIAQTNDASRPWVVVFGNGYNSENSHAVLFLLDPATGNVIKRIDTGIGNCNGLSTPVLIDLPPFDGKVDFIYAGDLKGNLWKFDLQSSNYNNWDVAFYDPSGTTPQPLFKAKGPGGTVQPITTKPDAMLHCLYPDKQGVIVIFGTGKYLGDQDLLDTTTQTIYGIWDYADSGVTAFDRSEYLGSFNRGSTPQLSNQPNSVSLLEQTAQDFDVDITVSGVSEAVVVRVISSNQADWTTTSLNAVGGCLSGVTGIGVDSCDPNSVPDAGTDPLVDMAKPDPVYHAGWYFDLPVSGERIVSDLQIRIGHVVYVSFIPDNAPCGTGGSSIVHETDSCTGGGLPEPQIDINEDGVIDEHDRINIGTEESPVWVVPAAKLFEGRLQPPAILRLPPGPAGKREVKYFSSSSGQIVEVREKSARIGMVSWKEVD